MKLYSLLVYDKPSGGAEVRQLKASYDLASFSFFQRGSVQEFMQFTGKILVERGVAPSRSSVKEQEYMCHCYVRDDGLSAVVIADTEYPQRVAFTLLTKVLDDFADKVPQWKSIPKDGAPYTSLPELLKHYQNPSQADSMTKVQEEIDETKIVLHSTIQAVLERGEKLDDLVTKSEDLSNQSKMFYKQARKMNSCCTWV